MSDESETPKQDPKIPFLTPPDRWLKAPVSVDACLGVYHGRLFICICTPWGWLYQRDDGVAFDLLADAIRSVKPAPPPLDTLVPPTE